VSEDSRAPAAAGDSGTRNLVTRAVTALVLAPLAIGILYAGGWFWAVLVTAVSVGIYVEWLMIVGARDDLRVLGGGVGALVVTGLCLAFERYDGALPFALLGLVVVAFLGGEQRRWTASGYGYAAAALLASVLVRADADWGFAALLLVLLVVWAADIGGYFAGRGIGGPKLWPRVSPKKTWSGAIGGFIGGLCVASGFAVLGYGNWLPLLGLAALLSVVSQLGDLFESAVKRRFGVKDSSQIIPGHGGLMDRLDGYVAAVVAAAVFGVVRGGLDGAGRGLMVW
jgi:phosphatidate cytidylyltransferase